MKTINYLIIFFVTLILISCKTNLAQVSKKEEGTKSEKSTKPEPACSFPLAPEYPGGNEAMNAFISENLKYPEEAKKKNISGTVLVTFLVLTTGELKDIKVEQGIGYGCDEEALRIVKLMPKWKPGRHLDKLLEMNYSLGIIFNNQ